MLPQHMLVFTALSGQQWRDVSVVDLGPVCARAAVTGRKLSGETDELLHIVPCSLTEQLSFELCVVVFIIFFHYLTDLRASFQNAFKALTDPPAIYLAINSDDSSIVYYKISTGFVKPSS